MKSIIPFHNNLQFANQVHYWAPFDTEERWRNHMAKSDTRQKLIKQNYIDPQCITYAYNSHGFRDEEFDNRECGIAMGCSFTHGTGLKFEDSWPQVLGSLLGIHCWNLGIGGASLDTVFRLCEHYIDLLQPRFLAILTPEETRFEYARGDFYDIFQIQNMDGCDFKDFFKMWITTDQNSQLNRKKNQLAISYLCVQRGIKIVFLDPITQWPFKECTARDLAHPNAISNRRLAKQFADLLQ